MLAATLDSLPTAARQPCEAVAQVRGRRARRRSRSPLARRGSRLASTHPRPHTIPLTAPTPASPTGDQQESAVTTRGSEHRAAGREDECCGASRVHRIVPSASVVTRHSDHSRTKSRPGLAANRAPTRQSHPRASGARVRHRSPQDSGSRGSRSQRERHANVSDRDLPGESGTARHGNFGQGISTWASVSPRGWHGSMGSVHAVFPAEIRRGVTSYAGRFSLAPRNVPPVRRAPGQRRSHRGSNAPRG